MSALRAVLAMTCAGALTSAHPAPLVVNDAAITGTGLPARLSDYRFFAGSGTARPAPQLIGYTLGTPLFSDYTEKQRLIYLPDGQQASVHGDGHVEFPEGAAIIKTFGVGEGAAFRPVETRVLLRRAAGWEALPYVWNADGSDAVLKVSGTRIPLKVTRTAGSSVDISYAVPNKNQCKECHQSGSRIVPIGPIWMNMTFADSGAERRFIRQATMPRNRLGKWPVWDDPASGSVEGRARAYLHSNCAHCHNPSGSASNSGLFLTYTTAAPDTAYGIYKRPVAAGRGSGGHEFAIAPGDPDHSIMTHRMNSVEPGIAMPEVGRSLVHEEGVSLIREWISSLPAK